MPTAGIVLTNKIKLLIGSTPVAMACLTQVSFDASAAMRDTSCFETDAYGAVLPSKKEAKISASGLWAFDAAVGGNAKVMHDAIINDTPLTFSFGTGVTGDPKISGTAFCSSFKADASGLFENCTYSIELMVSGAWTWTTFP